MKFAAFVLACSVLVISQCQTTVAAPPRPNIIFIIADDLGWADVGFHDGNAPTPHLDQLVAESLELTQHYVAPVCSPTRAGFLTGRYWSRFGITTPINTRGLPWDTMTLPKALQDVGYETCIAGKWHLGSKPPWGPRKFGFDHSYGSLAGGISPWNHRYKKGPYTFTWHRNDELIEEQGHVTDLLTKEAIDWIRSRGDSPFFAYLPYTAIHLPLKEPEQWVEKVPQEISGEVARHYAASVMHLDDSVGKILATLDEIGKRENTILVFTSDNGGSNVENNDLKYPDDNCPNGKLTGNNSPFRGSKATIYEGGTRVPTLVHWPGKISGRTSDVVTSIVDWMPTFCALAGFESDTDLKWDGIDLSSVLLDGTPIKTRPIYIAGPRMRAKSLRFGEWKLVVSGQAPDSSIELFDIESDPEEKSNLAHQNPEQTEHMLGLLSVASQSDSDAKVEN